MKNFLLCWLSLTLTGIAYAEEFRVDQDHSSVFFKVGHFGISNVYGRFDSFSGTVALDNASRDLNSIALTVNTASINTNVERRDNHLRSDDFFDVAVHPTAKFVSTRVRPNEDGTYTVTGDFTLMGVTNEVNVIVVKIGEGQAGRAYRVGGEGTFSIDRNDYGMTGFAGVVGAEVEITIAIEGVRPL